jgi:hypothetical protein
MTRTAAASALSGPGPAAAPAGGRDRGGRAGPGPGLRRFDAAAPLEWHSGSASLTLSAGPQAQLRQLSGGPGRAPRLPGPARKSRPGDERTPSRSAAASVTVSRLSRKPLDASSD